jgi:DNA-binding NtrC family response regulator
MESKKLIQNSIQQVRNQLNEVLPEAELLGANVLYIDDEAQNLLSFKANFRRDNFTVHTARTVEEALEILKNEIIHVVFCDYKMPKMNGEEVLNLIKIGYPDITPVIMTAYYPDVVSKTSIRHIIEKPWNLKEIYEIIKLSYTGYLLKHPQTLST